MEPKWLQWAKEIQAIAQNGLAYTTNKFDRERFERLRVLSVEILGDYTTLDHGKIKDLFCNEEGYQTAKVDVRGVIYEDQKILLVKEKLDGKWSLPGGWADYNLSVKENVIKEMAEEAGLKVEPLKLIALLDRNKHNEPPSAYGIYKAFVHCKALAGSFISNIETEESGLFKLEALPELSTGRVTKEQIEMCIRSIENHDAHTIFD